MQRALAISSLQCFSTPQFNQKHHHFHTLQRNKQYPFSHSSSFTVSRELKVSAGCKQKPQDINSENGDDDEDELLQEKVVDVEDDGVDLGWLPAFPHVLTASMSNFLFGYHIGHVESWN